MMQISQRFNAQTEQGRSTSKAQGPVSAPSGRTSRDLFRSLYLPFALCLSLNACSQGPDTSSKSTVNQNQNTQDDKKVFIADIDELIGSVNKGEVKSVEYEYDDSLGTAYYVTFKDGKVGLTFIPSSQETGAPKRRELKDVCAKSNPPIIITEKTSDDKARLREELQFFMNAMMGLMVGAMFVLIGSIVYKNRDQIFPKNEFKLVKSDTKFDDVRGNRENVANLKHLISLLTSKSNQFGAKPPKGVLLKGPPGTGKTLMARAIAGEMGYNFIACDGSSFNSMFIGQDLRNR